MLIYVSVVLFVIILYIIFGIPTILAGSPGVTPLPSVEIRSYHGQNLSSISDFHENSVKGPQYINESDYRLTITGLTNTTRVYTYNEVLNQFPHYSKVVTLFCVEGWDVTILWEGVLVRDLIHGAGIDPRANTVIFTAYDGYKTSFPLTYLMDNNIIMAYRMNNVTLPANRGFPFELVAEDKWGYKWEKWVEKIELIDNPNYRGYWEERGYSNSGDLNSSYFGN
ncbi:MAG: molybdopterin-dependent oxidoreductase [Methanomicrobiales archaeon]|nr:molybdopterin-dependent oxidoreductase [Methanomicrobiales archaeon]